jgi:membrane-associated phospholipid phosphatase
MRPTINRYREHFSDKSFLASLFIAIILFTTSLFINYYAGNYASESVSNYVTDIILSNTQVYSLDEIFIYGTYVFWIFFTLLCLSSPQKIPFSLKSIALFVIIRSIFISLTHIAPFPTQITVDPTSFMSEFTFGGDLFFSGHTGLPYLLALIYWENKYLRVFFMLTSIMFGITVLLAHLHYSIDVLSAFFITYTIYHIALRIFKEDRDLFYKS